MKDQNSKKHEEIPKKTSPINKHNKVDKILIKNLMADNKKVAIKNEESTNSSPNNNQKITGTQKLLNSISPPSYKTETYSSFQYNNKQNFNMLDNISEQGDGKNIPLTREKKIYLYLKNNNKIDNSNGIFLDNNSLIRGNDYFSDKISEKAVKIADKEMDEDKLNKTIAVNNKPNNLYNNYMDQKSLSRNTLSVREKPNNSFSSGAANNTIDNKNSKSFIKSKIAISKDTKNNNVKFFISQPRNDNKKSANIEQNKNVNNLSKITETTNSISTDGRKNNHKKLEHQHQKTEPDLFNVKYNNVTNSISNNKRSNKNNITNIDNIISNNKTGNNNNNKNEEKNNIKEYTSKTKSQPQEKSKKNEIFNRHNSSLSCSKIESKKILRKKIMASII
jgi:hypothetical protein